MSEKRFIWKCDEETCHIFDTVTKARYFYEGIMNLLNEQQDKITELEIELTDCKNRKEQSEYNLRRENEQLQAQLREKEEDERLYANEIVKLNKEAKEVLDFKSLGGDY